MAQMVKNLTAMQETRYLSVSQDDPLEEGKTTHSIILACIFPETEEPGRLQSMGSQRVGYNSATFTSLCFIIIEADYNYIYNLNQFQLNATEVAP